MQPYLQSDCDSVHISKTPRPIARHQNVAQHVSSKKQLSTKSADRHAQARNYHHTRKVS